MFGKVLRSALRSSIRPTTSLYSSATLAKKGYESLEITPLEDLRKQVCHEIAKDVLLPEYWKAYNSPDPSKLETRLEVVINSLGEKLEEIFEDRDSKLEPHIRGNSYVNLLSRPQVIANPNILMPLSITTKQLFGGRLRYDISNPIEVNQVRESYFSNFALGVPLVKILQETELSDEIKKMAQADAAKDAVPTISPESAESSQLQQVKQPNRNY
ncbi:MAG: hypothetical protein V4694_07320 [Pseudomonadota bacterium]